jgi:acetyl-CoA carboxylase biotin carboxylase subunit
MDLAATADTGRSLSSLSPLLIANRGEIAVRIARSAHELGLRTVAVFTDADRAALHTERADVAVRVRSYLDGEALIDAARRSGARAVHPGYGFLSENADFAAGVRDAGLTWVGPAPETITLMGDKGRAKQLAERAGVPVVPGTPGEEADAEAIAALAGKEGFPIVIKALAGGGGKGMRVVRSEPELEDALAAARREAESAFGDGRVLAERYLERPRHIEVQVLADAHGSCLHLGERECSLQRRHQKVIEEAPSPVVDAGLRERIGAAAIDLARACGYEGAGTVEFIVPSDASGFYFLEMNTRLQVEHPVTEMVTSIDLVHWQIRIARGEKLDIDPERALTPHGHAIECRIYAEDPDMSFMPSPGLIRGLRPASGPGIRDDGGVGVGYTVPVFYDSMIAKLVAWGSSRPEAVSRMGRALREYQVLGIKTTIPFFLWLMRQPEYNAGEYDTTYLDRLLKSRTESFSEAGPADEDLAVIAAGLDAWFGANVAAAGEHGAASRGSLWKHSARREALRG